MVFKILLGIAVAVLLPFDDAHAYIDPGTGSHAIQVLIAVIAGVSYSARIYWTNIRVFLSRFSKKNK
ncbi:MAG: hypothetical protein WC773_03255 [Patescibacteria group bacterium]|jgi:hypothetical protein